MRKVCANTKRLKEMCYFAVGTVLSFGPSQLVGLVKGSIDVISLVVAKANIMRLQHQHTHLDGTALLKNRTALEINKALMQRADRRA